MSILLDARSEANLPVIAHWGADLGELAEPELTALIEARRPVNSLPMSNTVSPGVIALHAAGGFEYPGVLGQRAGRDWSPVFLPKDFRHLHSGGTDILELRSADARAGLGLLTVIEVTATGLVRTQSTVQNLDSKTNFSLDSMTAGLPVPDSAVDMIDFTGRAGLERVPIRQPFAPGLRVRENRQGRGGHDASYLTIVGNQGFGFQHGEVWSVHVAWSGNQRSFTERLLTGAGRIGGGELLWPGELELEPGATYSTPWLLGSYGDGLDAMSSRYHDWVRSLPHSKRGRHPSTVNSWEAMYFDISEERLIHLATIASSLGIERFVVDDGWFGDRRDDSSSLGDWYPNPARWPNGLHRLVDHVKKLGMEFGLWFEPEMISSNSEVARAHPEWLVGIADREALPVRNQLVLDLSRPDVYAYLRSRMSEIIDEYEIDYIKWDFNRHVIDGANPDGQANGHAHVLATYRLMDELRDAFPRLELESCSSGGGRIDLEMATRVNRFWPSDNTDPLDRQAIQRWTGLLIPPEMLGAHIARPSGTMTDRTTSLAFRAGTALFGDLGIEWDISSVAEIDLQELREWVELWQELRELIAGGVTVRLDHPDPAVWVHGMVAPERNYALFAVVALGSTRVASVGAVRFAGLDASRHYAVADITPGKRLPDYIESPTWVTDGLRLTGAALAGAGIEMGAISPQQLRLVQFKEEDAL
ncbi:MAG TPA: alpha-galactosidase [Galbitalea sp.]|jgi:alpha-galactosidase|nr:alpha-galactosidase [Galbitalea sp.]